MKPTHATYALAALALLSTLNPQLSTCFAQGSLTPPGAPAPTMKSLAQIEPRTAISSAPYHITNAGAYYLTTNLTVSSGNGIYTDASNVTLDLNGFTISSTQTAPLNAAGILLNGNYQNLTVLNGIISSGVTNNGGVYSGVGFYHGITASSTIRNVRVSGITVSGCLGYGILLGASSTVVQFCTVDTVGGKGIVAQAVTDSTARQCGDTGIFAATANNCSGECAGSGDGVYAGISQNCYGTSASGNGLYATNNALNCYGSSSSGNYGLYAETALNCRGANYGSGSGLCAGSTAENCRGESASGDGLWTVTAENCSGLASGAGDGLLSSSAQNCRGSSGSGTGLKVFDSALNCYGGSISGDGLIASTAQNCIGLSSGSGRALVASDVATGCSCYSGSGIGIQAYIANSCRVIHGSTNITFKYNMP